MLNIVAAGLSSLSFWRTDQLHVHVGELSVKFLTIIIIEMISAVFLLRRLQQQPTSLVQSKSIRSEALSQQFYLRLDHFNASMCHVSHYQLVDLLYNNSLTLSRGCSGPILNWIIRLQHATLATVARVACCTLIKSYIAYTCTYSRIASWECDQ